MANARRCDVCGTFYMVPELDPEKLYDNAANTDMVRILRRKDTIRVLHDIHQFDTCEKCTDDVLDYILSRRAEWDKVAE